MNETLLARLILLQMRQAQQLHRALRQEMVSGYEGRWLSEKYEETARGILEQAEKLVAESAPPPVS